jgi:WD40 repeat protein
VPPHPWGDARSWIGFGDGGRTLIIAKATGAVFHYLDTAETEYLRESGRVGSAAFSADGSFLALITDAGEIAVWNTALREAVARLPVGKIRNLAFAGRDGNQLVATTNGEIVHFRWEPEVLMDLACMHFASAKWHAGRWRVLGENPPDPCSDPD